MDPRLVVITPAGYPQYKISAMSTEVMFEQPNFAMADELSGNFDLAMGPDFPMVEGEGDDEPKAPYYYYRDHSHIPDPDPTKPVTIPGRIPTFPAKLFAILSRPELSDIISWMPHGRSWKVHKPREFEVKVIPMYFDHAKFSSFIRQANGWGFKRVCTKGVDRNSHYHELFLRGTPHLLKFMKRPLTGSKLPTLHQHSKGKNCDPDFYKISEEHPLPESSEKLMHPLDESSFLNAGNNNRMLAAGSNVGRPPCTPAVPPMQSPEPQMTQLQAFFAQADDKKSPNQAFLLPRVPEQTQSVTSQAPLAPAPMTVPCPIREQEKELDPLTILFKDVYEEADHPTIEDPIIQSLVSFPSVPPPSSLTPVHTPVEQKHVFTQEYMYQAPTVPAVSPFEEKTTIQLPEPDHDDDLNFDDPFAGGFVASDFW